MSTSDQKRKSTDRVAAWRKKNPDKVVEQNKKAKAKRVKHPQTFVGHEPETEGWYQIGGFEVESQRWLLFRSTEKNGWCNLKLVLSPGQRRIKANYWLAKNTTENRYANGSAYKILAEKSPALLTAIDSILASCVSPNATP